jgi:hypothetical protein
VSTWGAPMRIKRPTRNHNRLLQFKNFPDRLLARERLLDYKYRLQMNPVSEVNFVTYQYVTLMKAVSSLLHPLWVMGRSSIRISKAKIADDFREIRHVANSIGVGGGGRAVVLVSQNAAEQERM